MNIVGTCFLFCFAFKRTKHTVQTNYSFLTTFKRNLKSWGNFLIIQTHPNFPLRTGFINICTHHISLHMHIQVCYWLQEDSLAVLACLSVRCPGLQGHPSGMQTLRAKQLTNVRWQHDVHTALGAHMLPSQTYKHIGKLSSFATLELINFSQFAVLSLSIFFKH